MRVPVDQRCLLLHAPCTPDNLGTERRRDPRQYKSRSKLWCKWRNMIDFGGFDLDAGGQILSSVDVCGGRQCISIINITAWDNPFDSLKKSI